MAGESSQLAPLGEMAETLKLHLDNSVTYLMHLFANAVTKGLNSKIQGLKAAARALDNFHNYRNLILFFCDRLDVCPVKSVKSQNKWYATAPLIRDTVIGKEVRFR